MLSEERIEDIADANGHATVISYGRPAKREVIWYDGDLTPFARAIESAATAPLLARIAELERELEEARKDAELGRTAMRFVDRAGDPHPGIDDADKICAEFYAAMCAVVEEQT